VTYIPSALRRLVEERSEFRCEYCLLPEIVSFVPHEVDHVISEKHGGQTTLENLAFSCWRCNRHKGTDLSSLDPSTGIISPLFNPRTQIWNMHFLIDAFSIVGLTPEGRTTAYLLRLNSDERLAERTSLKAV
jgi:hypothetical protein